MTMADWIMYVRMLHEGIKWVYKQNTHVMDWRFSWKKDPIEPTAEWMRCERAICEEGVLYADKILYNKLKWRGGVSGCCWCFSYCLFFFFTLFYFPVGSLDVFSSSLHMTIIEDVGSTRGDYSFIGLVAIWCDIGSNTFIYGSNECMRCG